MRLTPDERDILRTHRGNTAESRAIRIRLYEEAGAKYCGLCDTILPADWFAIDRRTLNGRPRSLGGRASKCRPCDKRRRNRKRKNIILFDFTGPERSARYVARMTDEERAEYVRRGNVRDRENYRRWYRERYAAGRER